MKIEDLNLDLLFGKDRAQEDEHLAKYFIKTRQYQEIFSGSKELVLGRKGSGKSSLFSFLTKELKEHNCYPLQISPKGEDFIRIKQCIDSYKDISLDDDFKYALVWRDFILTEIAIETLNITSKNDETGILKKYLEKNGKIQKDFVSRFTNSLIKVFGKGAIKTSVIDLEFDLSDFSINSETDEAKLKASIFDSISKNRFFVLFDNLDEPWKNNNEMNAWLRGLLLSMRQLKRDFNNLKLICFLRDDIFNEISKGSDLFDSQSEIIRISWKDNENFSLKKLLATRIAVYMSKKHPSNLKECDELISLFYPVKISYRTKVGVKYQISTTYIIDRTFSRPREFLQFCRLIIEKSQSFKLPVETDTIFIASKEFCDWKVRDLVGEYSKTYRNIDNCIFTLANTSTNWQLSYLKLKKHIDSISNTDKIYNIVNNKELNSDESISFLYHIGFLRKKKTFNFITSMEESYINIKVSDFDIHPAFRSKLISL